MNGLDVRDRRKKLKLTQEELAQRIGVSRNTIKNYENGGVIPESKRAILTSVLNGDDADGIDKTKEPYLTTKSGTKYYELPNGMYKMIVPFVPVRAYAGYVDEFKDAEFVEKLDEREFTVKEIHHGAYYSFEIKGDSMDDDSRRSLIDGDIVLARDLCRSHWLDGLRIKDYTAWIIVLKNNIVCKQIVAQDMERGTITCHSLNPSPEYGDFELSMNDICQLLNVVKRESDY